MKLLEFVVDNDGGSDDGNDDAVEKETTSRSTFLLRLCHQDKHYLLRTVKTESMFDQIEGTNTANKWMVDRCSQIINKFSNRPAIFAFLIFQTKKKHFDYAFIFLRSKQRFFSCARFYFHCVVEVLFFLFACYLLCWFISLDFSRLRFLIRFVLFRCIFNDLLAR